MNTCRCGNSGVCSVCTDARAAVATLGPWCTCGHTELAHQGEGAAGNCRPIYCECTGYTAREEQAS